MIRSRLSIPALLLTLASFAFAADKPKITLDEFFNYVEFPSVQISPNGNSVVIEAERADWDRQIFQTDLWLYRDDGRASGSLTRLTHSGHDSSPRWSPDGSWIAFLSERKASSGKDSDDTDSKNADESPSQIYLMRPDGGEAFAITAGDEEVHAFAWSPDSKTIYFATRTAWNKEEKDAYKKL
jgi:Tol biopolymer transport system component